MQTTSSRGSALLMVALLLATTLTALAPGAAAAATGAIQFQTLDETPLAPTASIYGSGQVVMLNLTDADLTNPTHTLRVKSTSDASGEDVILSRVRLGDGTFAYQGFVGVEKSNNPGNGEVYVQHQDIITATYEDFETAGGGASVVQAQIKWIETWDGSIALDKDDYLGFGEEVEIEVFDKDIPSAATSFCVRVTSDSDPVGIKLNLRQKVADGRYRGNLKFSQVASDDGMVPAGTDPCGTSVPSNSPSIHVASGDFFTVTYETEGLDARGRDESPEAKALFRSTDSGRIQFVTMDYDEVVSEDPRTPPTFETRRVVTGIGDGKSVQSSNAWIRVEDRDLAGKGSIVVNVRSVVHPSMGGGAANVDPSGRNVVLYETGAPRAGDFGRGTGEFIGHIGFIVGEQSQPIGKPGCDPRSTQNQECRLRVTDGAVIIARYDDANNQDGDMQVVETRAIWRAFITGTVDFKTDDDYLTSATQYNVTWQPDVPPAGADTPPCRTTGDTSIDGCHYQRGYVEVRDTDEKNAGTIQVRVYSSRDPLGINLTLAETNPDTGNPALGTGVFRGSFSFNATHSSYSDRTKDALADPVLWALGCDSVFVEYKDANDEGGKERLVVDNIEQVFTNTDPTSTACDEQNKPVTDSVSPALSFRKSATATVPEGVFFGYRTAWIHLSDASQNMDASRVEQTTRNVTLASDTLPATWVCCNDPDPKIINDDGFVQIQVKLTETGTNTGLFAGSFSFAPADGGDTVLRKLNVTDGDRVCAYYFAHNLTDVRFDLRTTCVTWYSAAPSILEFRSSEHQGASMANDLQAGPETFVFYNGTGHRWEFIQDLETLETNQAWVFVRDIDRLADTTIQSDHVDVNIRSETDLSGINVRLYERYGRLRMPAENVTFGGDTYTRPGDGPVPPFTFSSKYDDRGFIGVFNLTTSASDDDADALQVRDGDTISAFYVDPSDENGDAVTYVAHVDWNETHTASLSLDRDLYRFKTPESDPQNTAEITLTDKDLDTSVSQQTFTVIVETSGSGATLPVVLEETGPSTGVFKGKFQFSKTTTDPSIPSIQIADEDTVTVRYTDEKDVHGNTQKLEAEAKWLDATSTRLRLDKDIYAGFSSTAIIRLEDRNLDTTSGADSVNVWVTSESDSGIVLKLTETGATTGEFTAPLGFESLRDPLSAKIHVRDGDLFRVFYLDREASQQPPANDDRLVKTAEAKFLVKADAPPRLDIPTIPPVSDELGFIPIHVGQTIAFFPSAMDMEGKVVGYELDFGDGSPLIRQVEGRGPADEAILHAFGAEPFYRGYRDDASYTVRFTAWDDAGHRNTTTFEVRTLFPDKSTPGDILDLAVATGESTGSSVTLSWTAPENNDGSDDGKGPSGYDIRYSLAPITNDEEFEAATVATDVVFDPTPLAAHTATQKVEVRGLEANTDYYFAVRAQDSDGVDFALGVTFGTEKEIGKVEGGYPVTLPDEDLTLEDLSFTSIRAPRHVLGKLSGGWDSTGPAGTSAATDSTPPEGSLTVTSSSHAKDTAVKASSVTLAWNMLTDDSPVAYHYALVSDSAANQPGTYVISDAGNTGIKAGSTAQTTITLQNVAAGTYWFHVAACSDGGCGATASYGKIIIEAAATGGGGGGGGSTPDPTPTGPSLDDVKDANLGIWSSINVKREGDDNVVTWKLPAGHACEGIQIWANSGSGFEQIADIKKNTTAFSGRTFTHADASADARYLVTCYVAGDLGKGSIRDPANDIPGFVDLGDGIAPAAELEEPTGGIPWWVWIVLAVVVLAIIGTVVGVLVMRKPKDDFEGDDEFGYQETSEFGGDEFGSEFGGDEFAPEEGGEAWGDTPAYEEPAEEPYVVDDPTVAEAPATETEPEEEYDPLLHHLNCPNCGAGFTAHGEKPMVTECPSCGAKGVLR